MENTIQQLIDIVKQASSEMWRIALRQVYAQVAVDIIVILAIIAIFILLIKLNQKFNWRDTSRYSEDLIISGKWNCDEDDKVLWKAPFYTAIPFLALVVFLNAISIAQKLINPEYYAISVIVDIAKAIK